MDVATKLVELRQKHETLQQNYGVLQEENGRLKEVVEQFMQEILLLRDKRFGRKADVLPTGQQDLDLDLVFDEAEVTAAAEQQEEITVTAYTRKKRGRKPLPADLTRVEHIIDIDEADKQCGCGEYRQVIGEEVSEKLAIIPEFVYVQKTIRLMYACRNCEGSGDEEKPAVIVAPAPPAIIPKGIATPSLLATVFTNKFMDHLPYYRQEKRFKRLDISISRQNMSNWQVKSYQVIKPLIRLLESELHRGSVMQMDETTLQVLGEPNRLDTQKSYMWLARGGPPEHPVVRYRYFPTRSAEPAKELLKDFSGYLQTDGYETYVTVLKDRKDIIHVGCWAHARRYYTDAAKTMKKTGSAHEAVKWIARLYKHEKKLRAELDHGELTLDEFSAARKAAVEPDLDKFKAWLETKKKHLLPSSLTGKAVNYTLNQWDKLIRYLENPYLTPDNNAAERSIKPFVVSRKNWLFSGSPDGAESSCGLFSLIETAKENNLNPQVYLYHIFENAPCISSPEDWEALLPWNVSLPKFLDAEYIRKGVSPHLPQ